MSAKDVSTASVTRCVAKNISAVMEIENEFLEGRSLGDRVGDAISRVAGTLLFAVFHVVAVAVWMLANTRQIPGIEPFDPYPFSLLALLVSMEAVLLTTFVLMSQNRQNKQADHRAHLHLQIGLLAEQETTKIIQMLHQICQHLGIECAVHDTEFREMADKTEVDAVAHELKNSLQQARANETMRSR
jgi:uncharacterized membrane protein